MGGGPFEYCVTPTPKNWDLGIFKLGQTFGSGQGDCWDRGLGLGLGLDNKGLDTFLTSHRKL